MTVKFRRDNTLGLTRTGRQPATWRKRISRAVALTAAITFATGCAVVPHHRGPGDLVRSEVRNVVRHGDHISSAIGHSSNLVLSHGSKRHGRHGRRGHRGGYRGGVNIHHGGGIVAGIVAGAVLVALLVAAGSHEDDGHGHH